AAGEHREQGLAGAVGGGARRLSGRRAELPPPPFARDDPHGLLRPFGGWVGAGLVRLGRRLWTAPDAGPAAERLGSFFSPLRNRSSSSLRTSTAAPVGKSPSTNGP